jgi:hypothetical protein
MYYFKLCERLELKIDECHHARFEVHTADTVYPGVCGHVAW